MHWPSFLVGLLVLPVFVLAAGLTKSLMQSLRRRRTGFVGTRSSTPLARGAEPLEFASRVMGRIGRQGPPSRKGPSSSARAS